MHLFLATFESEVPTQHSRVPNRAQQGGRFLIVRSEREGDTPQFLPEVFAVKGSSPEGIR
jgi:hypothetical protein